MSYFLDRSKKNIIFLIIVFLLAIGSSKVLAVDIIDDDLPCVEGSEQFCDLAREILLDNESCNVSNSPIEEVPTCFFTQDRVGRIVYCSSNERIASGGSIQEALESAEENGILSGGTIAGEFSQCNLVYQNYGSSLDFDQVARSNNFVSSVFVAEDVVDPTNSCGADTFTGSGVLLNEAIGEVSVNLNGCISDTELAGNTLDIRFSVPGTSISNIIVPDAINVSGTGAFIGSFNVGGLDVNVNTVINVEVIGYDLPTIAIPIPVGRCIGRGEYLTANANASSRSSSEVTLTVSGCIDSNVTSEIGVRYNVQDNLSGTGTRSIQVRSDGTFTSTFQVGDLDLTFAEIVTFSTPDNDLPSYQAEIVFNVDEGSSRNLDTDQYGVRNCPYAFGTDTDADGDLDSYVSSPLATAEQAREFKQCEQCIGNFGTWTALGCISTTAQGVFNTLIRIALGIMGGVALLRLIYLGYLYNFGSEDQIKPATQDILATLGGLLIVIFSVLILRIIGVNVLDIVPPGFFGS